MLFRSGEVRYASGGSDAHISRLRHANLGTVWDSSKVHQQIGLVELFSDGDEEIRSATERDSAWPSELLGSVLS